MRAQARVRIRVADLMIWVLVVGVGGATIRAATAVWQAGVTHDVTCGLRLGAALLTTLMLGVLVRQIADSKLRPVEGSARGGVAVAWRLGLVGLLGALLKLETHLLDGALEGQWWAGDLMRPCLLTMVPTAGLAGLATALGPSRDERRPSVPTTARLYVWAGLAVAASSVVAMIRMESFNSFMCALDGMRSEMPAAVVGSLRALSLHDRALRAGLVSLPVLACWMRLAVLSTRAIDRPASVPGATTAPARELRALVAMMAATAAGTAWLVGPTLEGLDPWLAETLRAQFDPLNVAIFTLGLAGLALAPATWAAGPTGDAESARPASQPRFFGRTRLGRFALALVPLSFFAGCALELNRVRTGALRNAPAGPSAFGWMEAVHDALRTLTLHLHLPYWLAYDTATWLSVGLAQLVLACRLVTLLSVSPASGPAPLDAQLADRPTAARFLAAWAAFTILLAALLPISCFGGFALLQLVIQ